MDSSWWSRARAGRDKPRTVEIVWQDAPSDETLKERTERAILNGAKAAGAKGRVVLEANTLTPNAENLNLDHPNLKGLKIEAISVVEADVELPGPEFPVSGSRRDVEGWLGVAGIATR